MRINVNAISASANIPVCISLQDMQPALGTEGVYNTGLATQKEEVDESIRQYWPVRNELAVIDDTTNLF